VQAPSLKTYRCQNPVGKKAFRRKRVVAVGYLRTDMTDIIERQQTRLKRRLSLNLTNKQAPTQTTLWRRDRQTMTSSSAATRKLETDNRTDVTGHRPRTLISEQLAHWTATGQTDKMGVTGHRPRTLINVQLARRKATGHRQNARDWPPA